MADSKGYEFLFAVSKMLWLSRPFFKYANPLIFYSLRARILAGGMLCLAWVVVLRIIFVHRPRQSEVKSGEKKNPDLPVSYGNPFEMFELQNDKMKIDADEPCPWRLS